MARTPTRSFTIPADVSDILKELADQMGYEGNESQAIRYLARQWKMNKDLETGKQCGDS